MKVKTYFLLLTIPFSINAMASGWVEGIPAFIQKSDYGSLHLIYIQMENPVTTTAPCDSKAGIVIEDSNASSKTALALAMTALATGKTFRC